MKRFTIRWGNHPAVPVTFDMDFVLDMDKKTYKAFMAMVTRLADYEDTGLSPEQIAALNNNAHSNAGGDACAHAIYEGKLLRRPASAYCHHCGTHLETAYHEDRLYSVACSECKTVTLVKAKNPDEAARIVGEPMPF